MRTLEKREDTNLDQTSPGEENFDEKGYTKKLNEINQEKEDTREVQEKDIKKLNKKLHDSHEQKATENKKEQESINNKNTSILKKKTWRGKIKGFFKFDKKWRSEDKNQKWRPEKLDESARWKNNSDRGGHGWGGNGRGKKEKN